MTFLPIVDRELRTNARRASTYWTRTVLGGAVCLIWFGVLVMSPATTPIHTKAQVLFWTVTALAFAFCLLAGILLTADCVSGEKRDGTLGLLFLTDLESYDVVFGKLAATSLGAAYGLLCVLPSLALTLLLGGVTVGEFWRITAALVVTLFLSLTIGLAISAVSRDVRQAMAATLLALMLLAGVPPLLWWLAHAFTPAKEFVADLVLYACPPYDLALGRDGMYSAKNGPQIYWTALFVQFGLAVLTLVFAALLVPRVWADAPEETVRRDTAWQRWCRFGGRITQRRRRKMIDASPFCWLATRDRLPAVLTWVVVTLLFAIWAAFLGGSFVAATGKNSVCFSVAVFMAYAAYVLWKSFVAIEAARRVSEDRLNGSLELLMVTDLEVESVLAGQRRALRRMFLVPGLVVLFMNVVLLGMVADYDKMRLGAGLSGKTFFVFAIGALFVAADLSSLGNTGMWMGLRARRLQNAFLGMLGRVMLMPWLGIALSAVSLLMIGFNSADLYILLFFWMLVSLIVDGVMGAKARFHMERGFRKAASGDYEGLKEMAAEIAALREAPQPA
jgi:ABC-type transport system involved in multi-copper enzyme maturation permease subunit